MRGPVEKSLGKLFRTLIKSITVVYRCVSPFPGKMCPVLAATLILAATISTQQNDSCVTCHSALTGDLSKPVSLFKNDIHRSRGLSCNDCHGGDPTKEDKFAAKASSSGYLGTPKGSEILSFCGKCHSDAGVMKRFNPSLRVDQVQEYLTSVHGKRLQTGDQKVATCVSCHSIHGIRASSDPLSPVHPLKVAETCAKCHADANYIQEYGIGHNQFEGYKASVHANALYKKQDLSAPTCNDCHGNHGAAPPGIASVANVCGQCHSRQSELFQNSRHKSAFDKLQAGECVRCHGNHAVLVPNDQLAGIGKGSVCISCHSNDKGFQAARIIQTKMSELKTRINDADELLDRAERAGMEVSKPKFDLQGAVDSLTQARVLIHGTSIEEIDKVVNPGLKIAMTSFQAGEGAFAELSFRRKGLAVSLIFIVFLAVLVYLKIRQIESREEA